MNVEILKPEQYQLWNDFVDISPQGDIFCYSWWLDAITRSNFKIIAVIKNSEILAGMPLAYDSENMINMPPLTRTLGVLYKESVYKSLQKQSSAERKWITELLKYLPGDSLVQMYMHHNFKDWLPLRWCGFKQTTRYTYLIDYKLKTVTDLWNNLDKLRKRMINRATKNQISVELSDDIDLVYKYTSMAYKRQGLKFRIPLDEMKRLDDAILKNGNRIILTASDSNRVHAALYACYSNKSAYYLLSGSDPLLRKMGGHTLLLWEAIKYFIDKVSYFNLGGSDIERIETHLRGFGGILTPYFHIYNDRLLAERNSFKYHITEILFHCRSIAGKIINKFRNTGKVYYK